MRNVVLLSSILGLICISACTAEQKKEEGTVSIHCVTSDATAITQSSATLNGAASIGGTETNKANAYFYYSTTQADAKTLKASGQRIFAGTIPNTGGDFSAKLNSLSPATTYYYAASVSIDNQEELGSVKSFTTQDKPIEISVTGESADIKETSAKLYGWCNQEGAEGTSVVFGIEYSTTDLTTAATSITASEKDAENKYCCQVTGLLCKTLYYYRAFTLLNGIRTYGEVKTFTTNLPQAIDMCTVVNGKNVKWASCDIGAYYAWGETETKSDYSWSTYKFGTGPFSKYNTEDNKTVLDPEDDVAHVKLGGTWRMPTDEEWTALRTQCTWTWTTQNGVNGMLITATNGNSIFLPADDTIVVPDTQIVGSGGNYWSSSLNTDNPSYAWYVYFMYPSNVSRHKFYRYRGLSVRPVSE